METKLTRTSAERLAIYKKALEHFQNPPNEDREYFICVVIAKIIHLEYAFRLTNFRDARELTAGMKQFPEFMKMKPEDVDWGNKWWDTGDDVSRINALETIISGMEKKLKIKK